MKKIESFETIPVGGHGYTIDRFGVIHLQPPYEHFIYDKKYVEDRYIGIPQQVSIISHLRAGILAGVTSPAKGAPILDVGYGSGGFMKVIHDLGYKSCGIDVTGFPVPEGCHLVEENEMRYCHWHAITFFDSVEHMIPHFLTILNTSFVMISAPWCHEPPGTDWFLNWKHRRPLEHLYHFNPNSLKLMMISYGYTEIWRGHPEDVVRRPSDDRENILTSIFARRDLME